MSHEKQAGFDAVMKVAGVKEAGSALRKRLRFEWHPSGGLDSGLLNMFLEGQPLRAGTVSVSDGRVTMSRIEDEKMRGMGLGKKMYGELMRRMPDQTLSSDSRVSGGAKGVWENFERNPDYAFERMAGAMEAEPTLGERFNSGIKRVFETEDGSPMFRAALPDKAAL